MTIILPEKTREEEGTPQKSENVTVYVKKRPLGRLVRLLHFSACSNGPNAPGSAANRTLWSRPFVRGRLQPRCSKHKCRNVHRLLRQNTTGDEGWSDKKMDQKKKKRAKKRRKEVKLEKQLKVSLINKPKTVRAGLSEINSTFGIWKETTEIGIKINLLWILFFYSLLWKAKWYKLQRQHFQIIFENPNVKKNKTSDEWLLISLGQMQYIWFQG